jgi:hypothetical protein
MKISLSISSLFGFLILSFIPAAWSSPHPATGSSLLLKADQKFFNHSLFTLNSEGTQWVSTSHPTEDIYKFIPKINPSNNQAQNKKSVSEQASMSVRSHKINAKYNLESYAKSWVKEYSQYGFDVLGSRPFEQVGFNGLVIDLIHKKKSKQLRQVLFEKDKQVVVFTCTDEMTSFSQSIQSCNQIIQSFRWK